MLEGCVTMCHKMVYNLSHMLSGWGKRDSVAVEFYKILAKLNYILIQNCNNLNKLTSSGFLAI